MFLVEDMRGAFRVVGSDKWPTKTTVAQDLGQGATGTTSTTINVEASDECPAPFYAGIIATEDGDINPGGNPNQNTGGNNVAIPAGTAGGRTVVQVHPHLRTTVACRSTDRPTTSPRVVRSISPAT